MMNVILDKLLTLNDVDVTGKRVLLRTDLNVPMLNGEVGDTTRLERVLPTIKGLAKQSAKVVIISHFGRPKGQRDIECSLRPVAAALGHMLDDIPVRFVDDCIGDEASKGLESLSDGSVAVLENLRFHAGEESNDKEFAQALAEHGDIYINDAFSTSHRAHSSIEGVTHFLPSYAGPLLMTEINALSMALELPQRPVAAVVGGAKVSTKISVLSNLAAKVDMLIIGGGMANTFLYAQGMDVGKSLCEPDYTSTVETIMSRALESNCRIVLPQDAVVANEFKAGAEHKVCDIKEVPEDGMILDAGPQSVNELIGKTRECKTLLWNGPLGAFEIEPFGEGTFALARAVADRTKEGALVTIAGGGDTVAALNAAGVTEYFSYVSTAGGAFLEWLEGRELPGIVALAEANRS